MHSLWPLQLHGPVHRRCKPLGGNSCLRKSTASLSEGQGRTKIFDLPLRALRGSAHSFLWTLLLFLPLRGRSSMPADPKESKPFGVSQTRVYAPRFTKIQLILPSDKESKPVGVRKEVRRRCTTFAILRPKRNALAPKMQKPFGFYATLKRNGVKRGEDAPRKQPSVRVASKRAQDSRAMPLVTVG